MANEFIEIPIPEDLSAASTVFPELQLAHLINLRAAVAKEKINLAYDPDGGNTADLKFIREHEYLRGQLDILGYIINVHENNKNALVTDEVVQNVINRHS